MVAAQFHPGASPHKRPRTGCPTCRRVRADLDYVRHLIEVERNSPQSVVDPEARQILATIHRQVLTAIQRTDS